MQIAQTKIVNNLIEKKFICNLGVVHELWYRIFYRWGEFGVTQILSQSLINLYRETFVMMISCKFVKVKKLFMQYMNVSLNCSFTIAFKTNEPNHE